MKTRNLSIAVALTGLAVLPGFSCQPGAVTLDDLIVDAQIQLETDLNSLDAMLKAASLDPAIIIPEGGDYINGEGFFVVPTTPDVGDGIAAFDHPEWTIKDLMNGFRAATAEGKGGYNVPSLRNHALAVSQTEQKKGLNAVNVKLAFAEIAYDSAHVRCLTELNAKSFDQPSIACELAADVAVIDSGFRSLDGVARKAAELGAQEVATWKVLTAQVDVFVNAASAAKQDTAELADLKTSVKDGWQILAALDSNLDGRVAVFDYATQAAQTIKVTLASIQPLFGGNATPDQLHVYQHNQTDLEFIRQRMATAYPDLAKDLRDGAIDGIDATIDAAIASVHADLGTPLEQAAQNLAKVKEVRKALLRVLQNPIDGDPLTITNVQKAKHDAAMAAIQNAR